MEEPVILAQMENKMQSRGSGFVRFKEEKSVSAAVQAQYVTMAGTPAEIKSLIPKMAAESEKMSLRQQEQEKNCNCQSPPLPVAAKVSSSKMVMEANKREQGSWLDKVVQGQPNTLTQAHNISSPKDSKSMPVWLKACKKWFPRSLLTTSSKASEWRIRSLLSEK
ncbi:hypothetical protein C1H46_021145 [Malus baccata]|uniref:RRM domain-containing protein n=1 Tax=Malus baccata TaxID=106549 RepID=A0A540M3B8_MALBA|nr:hypothetical protein C1H46_021145 [Malus baccata]